MRVYTNKLDKVDARKCVYAEIRKNDKNRKKAARRTGKASINDDI